MAIDRHYFYILIPMFIAVFYLAIINYCISFVTLDELRYLVASSQELMQTLQISGRFSHYIGSIVNYFISFHEPNNIALTPRYLSMIMLLIAIWFLLKSIGFSTSFASVIASFAIISHQVDWQHNGLIAFYGDYNIFLSAFIFAILIERALNNNKFSFLMVFILCFISFGSELFVALASLYVITKAIVNYSFKYIYLSAFSWAVFVYAIFAIYFMVISDPIHFQGMHKYLASGLTGYSVDEIFRAAFLYVAYSVPYFNVLLNQTIATAFGGFIVLLVGIFIFAITIAAPRCGPIETNNDVQNIRNIPIYIVLVGLLILPQFLMAIQPQKHDAIISGTDTRYAFSLYTWISMVFLAGVVYRLTLQSKKNFRFVILSAMILSSAFFFVMNIMFASTYVTSKKKWLSVGDIVRNSHDEKIPIPAELLKHPYILPVDRPMMKRYVWSVYGKSAVICYSGLGYDLSTEAPELVHLTGFHGGEPPIGRWTSASASIALDLSIKPGNVIEILFSGAFGENAALPTIFRIGDQQISQVVRPGEKIRIVIPTPVVNPIIKIETPKATSPLKLGVSGDPRELGIMIKNIRVIGFDVDGKPRDILGGCH